ncbi:MAG: peptidyl-prolyl cis-trans isomerase [Planctomycetales bacterium]|nr:peptidyl-prolyl cis-trans isomerase [Planctomycetales bacterium]
MTLPRRIFLVPLVAIGLVGAAVDAQPLRERYGKMTNAENAVQPVDECQVIAQVNGEVILACELMWNVNLRLEQIGDQVPPEHLDKVHEQLMQQSLMGMLDLRMIYSDFRRNAPQADLAKIHESLNKPFEEQEIPRLMKMLGLKDRQQLDERLMQLGTSLAERQQDFYKVTIARSWINEGLTFNREVTHQDLLDYYNEHQKDYEYPTQARWEELMVDFSRYPTKAEAWRAICEMGNEAFAQAQQAKSPSDPAFESIAKSKSQGLTASEGGVHDWTTKGALAADEVDEAIFATEAGKMSPIVVSPEGYHIVRVLEQKLAGRTPFTEVQQEIKKQILDERFQHAIAEKIAKLKQESYVWTVYTGDLAREQEIAEKPGETQTR